MQGQLFTPALPWRKVRDGHPVAQMLYERHYSSRENRNSKLICGPGYKLLLLTHDDKALFTWWKQKFRNDGQEGVNCAVFRNESKVLSSLLLLEAEKIVWAKWPGERLFTFVNAQCIRSTNPGFCFKIAGWTHCGVSAAGLLIFEKYPI